MKRGATLDRVKRWLGDVLLFFGWGFVMHASGLLLHELAGHGLAYETLACGIAGVNLTYFGHGVVHSVPCAKWTWTTRIVADWAGLAVTIAAGLAAAGVLVRAKTKLTPLVRLLLAQVFFFFLIGQLAYATNGGFHNLYDPGRSGLWLQKKGLHVLAWLPPMIAYATVAFFGARMVVDAFREHFASRSRLHTLKQLAATLGVAGVVYWLAFTIEKHARADMPIKGVAVEAQRIAVVRGGPPPFPIDQVLHGIALAAVIAALARPVLAPEAQERHGIPRNVALGVAASALFLVVAVTLFTR